MSLNLFIFSYLHILKENYLLKKQLLKPKSDYDFKLRADKTSTWVACYKSLDF